VREHVNKGQIRGNKKKISTGLGAGMDFGVAKIIVAF